MCVRKREREGGKERERKREREIERERDSGGQVALLVRDIHRIVRVLLRLRRV